jgi:multidrug efflux system outer membrane protein
MMGPDYTRPATDIPQAWRIQEKDVRDASRAAWWEKFNDPVLNDLVTTALRENKDVRIAAARVDEFAGQLQSTRAALFPQASGSFDATRQRASQQASYATVPPGTNTRFNTFQPLLSASWELDFWGRLRRATEASRADLLATQEARQAVVLSLVASVTTGYITLRDLDRQLEIARETADSRGNSLRVFDLRFAGGVVSQLELSQNQSEYAQAVASIPPLELQIAQTENGLSTLIGRNPGPIPRGRTIDALAAPDVPAGLPSDLLTQRPDIRQSEQELIAANARIGVARAAYFPTISLTGALGSASTQLSNLFTGPAALWSYGASIAGPIFTAGAIAGQVQVAEARQQQALIGYQKAIQSAFADVDNALVVQVKSRETLDALGKQIDALATYSRLARLRYENGYTSYIEVLDAERALFAAQLLFVDQQAQVLNASVGLYKAMGGDWVDLASQVADGAEAARSSVDAAPH